MTPKVAGVHPLVEEVHRLALAGPFDAADQDEAGELLEVEQLVLRLEQGLPELRLLALPGGLVDFVGDLGGVEHGAPQASATDRMGDVPGESAGDARQALHFTRGVSR